MSESTHTIKLAFDAESKDLRERLERVTEEVRREALSLAFVVVRDRLRTDPQAAEAELSALALRAVAAFRAGAALAVDGGVSPDGAPAAPCF